MESRPQTWPAVLLTALARAALAFTVGLTLWAVAPTIVGWTPRVVLSGSMAPRINPGDVVVTAGTDPARVRAGQVLAFAQSGHPHSVLVHRVERRNQDGTLITRGDANTTADPDPVSSAQIEGIGRLRVPFIGLPALWLHRAQWPQLLAVVAGLAAAAWFVIRNASGPRPPSRSPAGVAGTLTVVLLLAGTARRPAYAAFTGTTQSPANTWTAAPVMIAPNQYVSTVKADAPAFFYRLTETSGSTAADASGNGVTGTYQGSWVYGVPGPLPRNAGTAVKGNGTSTCVTSRNSVVNAGQYSLEVWFRGGGTSTATLAQVGSNTPTTVPHGTLSLSGSGTVSFSVANQAVSSTGGFADGAWHHTVATLSASTGQRLYVDGSLAASSGYPSGVPSGNATAHFGCTITGTTVSASYPGALGDAAAYPAPLTATRVLAHYWAA